MLSFPLALADHGRIEPQLAGTTLCTEPRSASADVSGPEGEVPVSLKREMRIQLEAHLDRAEVRYEKRRSCVGQRATALLSLEARYLDPETYLGFPENAYTYVVSLQAGAPANAPTEGFLLEKNLYASTVSDIVSITDMEPEFLTIVNSTVGDFAQAWRQDNIVPVAHYLTFIGIALLLALARVTLMLAL